MHVACISAASKGAYSFRLGSGMSIGGSTITISLLGAAEYCFIDISKVRATVLMYH